MASDHSTNVGWDVNTATNGIIINGDNVTMYGLFVEHFNGISDYLEWRKW